MAVYFIENELRRVVKIGHGKDPGKRLSQVQTGNHEPLHIVFTVPGGERLEASLHDKFKQHRIRGEWFEFSEDIANFIYHDVDTRPAVLAWMNDCVIPSYPRAFESGVPDTDENRDTLKWYLSGRNNTYYRKNIMSNSNHALQIAFDHMGWRCDHKVGDGWFYHQYKDNPEFLYWSDVAKQPMCELQMPVADNHTERKYQK